MRVLVVGLGSIARKHIAALKKIEGQVEIFALRSGQNATDEEGITNVFSVEDAEAKNVDFILISTPTFLHHKNVEELITLKKPLLIEKPLSDSLQIEKVIPVILENGVQTYIACNLRFLNALNFVRQNFINNNYRINEVNVYCGSFLPDWRPQQDYRKSYSACTEKGGGVHLDLIHEIDYLFWLFGKPSSVISVRKSNSSLKINSADYANYILDYDLFSASVLLNYYRRDPKRTLEIVTNKSTILVDLISNKVFENGILVYSSEQKIIDTYEEQLRFFFKKIQLNEHNTFNDITEAVEVLKICLA